MEHPREKQVGIPLTEAEVDALEKEEGEIQQIQNEIAVMLFAEVIQCLGTNCQTLADRPERAKLAQDFAQMFSSRVNI